MMLRVSFIPGLSPWAARLALVASARVTPSLQIRARMSATHSAHEVDNGLACGCICPACRHQLIAANRGTNVIPYFRHAADSDCVEGFLNGVLLKAREIALQAQRLMLPAFEGTVRDYVYYNVYTRQVQVKPPPAEVFAERIEAPFDEGGLHADLAFWVKGRRLLVIFGVTGRAISGKLKPLRETHQTSIVVDLSGLDLNTTHEPETPKEALMPASYSYAPDSLRDAWAAALPLSDQEQPTRQLSRQPREANYAGTAAEQGLSRQKRRDLL
ncbi:hypothetical protein D3C78_270750 [compost metagenome]